MLALLHCCLVRQSFSLNRDVRSPGSPPPPRPSSPPPPTPVTPSSPPHRTHPPPPSPKAPPPPRDPGGHVGRRGCGSGSRLGGNEDEPQLRLRPLTTATN